MMKRWRFPTKPHIIADSGFGSFPLLTAIAEWGGTTTLSIPKNETNGLATFLSYNLPIGNWRACVDGKNIIFSVQCKKGKGDHNEKEINENTNPRSSITYKYIITNAFKCIPTNYGVININENPNSKYKIIIHQLKNIQQSYLSLTKKH